MWFPVFQIFQTSTSLAGYSASHEVIPSVCQSAVCEGTTWLFFSSNFVFLGVCVSQFAVVSVHWEFNAVVSMCVSLWTS